MIYAKATFTPGNPQAVLDTVLLVKIFAKVQRAQRIIVDHAQSLVTGELKNSIEAVEPVDTYHEIIGEVVATAGHAGFVEFGTGLRGMGTYPFPLPTSGVPYTNSWTYDYKKQNWKGMPARPYLRPSLDTARGEILGEFKA